MPYRPLRPCSFPNCPDLTRDTRCKKHQGRRPPGESRLDHSWRWRKYSKRWLDAHPLCVDPFGLHQGRPVPATVTDHIVPHRGNDDLCWSPTNHQSLCGRCHARKSAIEMNAKKEE